MTHDRMCAASDPVIHPSEAFPCKECRPCTCKDITRIREDEDQVVVDRLGPAIDQALRSQFEFGYLQALEDVKNGTVQAISEPSHDDELLGQLLLDRARVVNDDTNTTEAPDPHSDSGGPTSLLAMKYVVWVLDRDDEDGEGQ